MTKKEMMIKVERAIADGYDVLLEAAGFASRNGCAYINYDRKNDNIYWTWEKVQYIDSIPLQERDLNIGVITL